MSAGRLPVVLQPSVLTWARARAGLSELELASKIGVNLDRVIEWERTGRLRFADIDKVASATYTPAGSLYLTAPPEENLPLPDFRVVAGAVIGPPSPNLLDVLDDAERRQAWYREYVVAAGNAPLDFVGNLATGSAVVPAAVRIRERLGLDASVRANASTWEDALRLEIDRIERSGIIVLRNGIVGTNTHRPLDVDEFRGFAMADPYAPLIFINARDAKGAQMFTLMHELVHLWIGESGVSNFDRTLPVANEVERYSNGVAAEILLPANELMDAIRTGGGSADAVPGLARRYKVSTLVILRRLFDVGELDWDSYRDRYEAEVERFRGAASAVSTGGDFYRTQTARSSRRFATALIQETLEGRTSWRDAYALLGVRKAETFDRLARHLGFPI
jgi:Zn-dependent peptidase ImmA (M78 family)